MTRRISRTAAPVEAGTRKSTRTASADATAATPALERHIPEMGDGSGSDGDSV
jgi:hypothetical protein